MAKRDPRDPSLRAETRLALAGRSAVNAMGAVNPPVHHASTIVVDSVDDLYHTPKQTYARQGMQIHTALCDALIAVEGGAGATLAPSGLGACTLALLTLAEAGGHVLMTDSAYGPTRRFCDKLLKRYGVSTTYYDPRIGAGIADLIRDETRAIFIESPGSLTFEIQDVPAIVKAAQARGVATILDNTYSAGLLFKPFVHGVDISVQAITKYQAGHADLLMGAVISREPAMAARVADTHKNLGLAVAPDDAFMALRGMRTLAARMKTQSESALKVATWLASRPEVDVVLHPALPSHPDHAIWKRDFEGAAGLFSFILKPASDAKQKAFLESLTLFSLGFSWGGYESLALPCDPQITRTASPWKAAGPLVRFSIGLEHPDDLIADIEQALGKL